MERLAREGEQESTLRLVPEEGLRVELHGGGVAPEGWSVSRAGIWEVATREQVAKREMVLTARYRDIETGEVSLGCAWRTARGWHETVVPRSKLMDSRSLVALAAEDAPINSDNARQIVRYLTDFEASNDLPDRLVSSVMGWQASGGFLWGRTLIGASAEEGVELAEAAGVTELADALTSAGSWEGWLQTLEYIRPHPRVWLGIYAACVPALMELLPTLPNFILDVCGETSMGKTTLLRGATSVWGNPDERTGGYLRTWDSTRVYIERAAGALGHGLPLILDDTKRASRPEHVARTVYDVASGSGRGRGSIDGMRASVRWRTVLLSTGEQPITSFSKDGGTKARAICIWGSPFEGDAEVAVTRFTIGCLENYGHLGPRLVRWLMDERHRSEVRELYATAVEHWRERCAGNVAKRMAAYLAALDVVADVIHGRLQVPDPGPEPLQEAHAAVEACTESDPPKDALDALVSWAAAHQDRFYARHLPSDGAGTPTAGWLGSRGERYLAVLPDALDSFLRQRGYDVDAVRRSWYDRQWLDSEAGKHRTKKVPVGSRRPRCVVVNSVGLGVVDALD
jgi:uncharacterized protein (DUF927 family)